MKIKEILLNKWGWAGAVIGIILDFYVSNLNPNNLLYNFFTVIALPWSKLMVFLSITDGIIIGISSFVYFAVIGFIAGLILQKLWRKFR